MSYTIIYASDHNYVNFLLVSMGSLLRTNCHISDLRFCIVSDHLTGEDVAQIDQLLKYFNREYTLIPFEKICTFEDEIKGFPKVTYSKLFVNDLINDDIALYLDVDTIICDKLDMLLYWNFSPTALAGAVLDTVKPLFKMSLNLDKHSNYYNAGIILWNVKKIKEESITDKFREFISCYYKEHGTQVPHNDQGVFNYVCHNKIDTLLPQYNLMSGTIFFTAEEGKSLFCTDCYYSEQQLLVAKKSPIIIHFTEGYYGRPWNKRCTHPYKQYYISACKAEGINAFWINEKLATRKCVTIWMHNNLPKVVFALYMRLLERRKKIGEK